jgi:hypothetical protein
MNYGSSRSQRYRWQKIMGLCCCLTFSLLAGCGAANDKSIPITSDDGVSPSSSSGPDSKIVGHVMDAAGTPIVEATIAVVEGSVAVPEMAMITGADGAYIWPLPVGTFTLSVHKDGYASVSAKVEVHAKETVTQDFVLTK